MLETDSAVNDTGDGVAMIKMPMIKIMINIMIKIRCP